MNQSELPSISIVVPVYNRESVLKETLQSIADQRFRPIQLIVVDNLSQDGSLKIAQQFGEEFSHPTFQIEVIQALKKGANAARNEGLKKVQGDYVLFFDSDDLMHSDCILSIVEQLQALQRPEVLAYPFLLRTPNGHFSKRPRIFSTRPSDQLYNTVLPSHSFCIKRTCMEKVGLWDEELQRWQDLEFGFRVLLRLDPIRWFTTKPLYEVRQQPDSISTNSYTTDHELLYASLMKIKKNIEEQAPSLEKTKQQKALCFKICSMAGQIDREGRSDLGRFYLQKARRILPLSQKRAFDLLLRLQFFYERHGGRGFWRLFRMLGQ